MADQFNGERLLVEMRYAIDVAMKTGMQRSWLKVEEIADNNPEGVAKSRFRFLIGKARMAWLIGEGILQPTPCELMLIRVSNGGDADSPDHPMPCPECGAGL